jgi:hypothetical protein
MWSGGVTSLCNFSDALPVFFWELNDQHHYYREAMRIHSVSIRALFTAITAVCLLSTARAEDKKADPSGKWTWSVQTPNGETRETTATFKLEGGNVTGTISGRNGNETPIENGKLAGDELSFSVTRERNGNKFTTKYHGKLSSDSIKGKMDFERNGEPGSRDWEAKRAGGAAAGALTGNWQYSFTTPGGQTFEPTLKLKQEGEVVTGVVVFGENESPISEGKITGSDVSFIVKRERDGQTFTSKYNGKLEGEAIKGKINSNFGGNDRTYDFEAKRVK